MSEDRSRHHFFTMHLDMAGFVASFLCAIHCMAIPLLFVFGATNTIAWLDAPIIEFSFLGVAVIIATWSLGRDFRVHQKWLPLILGLIGFAFLIGPLILEAIIPSFPHHLEPILAGIGGFTLATAHYFNWRYHRLCKHHHTPQIHAETSHPIETVVEK